MKFLIENKSSLLISEFKDFTNSIDFQEVFQSLFLKKLNEDTRFRFIRKEIFYAFALKAIYRNSNLFQKGSLKKIKDPIFMDRISFSYLIHNNSTFDSLKKQNNRIVQQLSKEQKYELAAGQNGKFELAWRIDLLKCWPDIEQIDLDKVRNEIGF